MRAAAPPRRRAGRRRSGGPRPRQLASLGIVPRQCQPTPSRPAVRLTGPPARQLPPVTLAARRLCWHARGVSHAPPAGRAAGAAVDRSRSPRGVSRRSASTRQPRIPAPSDNKTVRRRPHAAFPAQQPRQERRTCAAAPVTSRHTGGDIFTVGRPILTMIQRRSRR